jgi:hypothetical protein
MDEATTWFLVDKESVSGESILGRRKKWKVMVSVKLFFCAGRAF